MPFHVFLRASQRQGLLKDLGKRIEKRLDKQWKKLDEALHDPAHDRHRLRLLIKRVRYGIEAYPELDRLPKAALPRLKSAQSALGDWHDCVQWLAMAEQERICNPASTWQTTMAKAEQRADRVLDKLSSSLLQITLNTRIPCGSELLAKAMCQLILMLTGTPLSRASPLPQGEIVALRFVRGSSVSQFDRNTRCTALCWLVKIRASFFRAF
jgi:hypothetical protein